MLFHRLEELVEAPESTLNLVAHDLRWNGRGLLLQQAQDLDHFGRKHSLLEAQHLPDFHGRALEFAQTFDHPLGISNEVVGPPPTLRLVRAADLEQPAPHDRGTDPSHQAAHLQGAQQGGGCQSALWLLTSHLPCLSSA